MARFKLSVWTGPSLVTQIADKLREAGVSVAVEGTEHIHIEADGWSAESAGYDVLAALSTKYGTDFGLRPKGIR